MTPKQTPSFVRPGGITAGSMEQAVAARTNQLLTPALSSLEEERESFFVGWLPGVGPSGRAPFLATPG
jgi:hypothetical protein